MLISSQGATSQVLAGLSWAVNDIIAKGAKATSVINMSLCKYSVCLRAEEKGSIMAQDANSPRSRRDDGNGTG